MRSLVWARAAPGSIRPRNRSRFGWDLYTATIPAGSFHQLASGRGVTVWAASETINSVSLALDILSLGHNSYQFGAAAQPVNLTAVPNPVPVSLSIGNNSGSTSVNATRVPRLAATGP
jgi:hypothetical protein